MPGHADWFRTVYGLIGDAGVALRRIKDECEIERHNQEVRGQLGEDEERALSELGEMAAEVREDVEALRDKVENVPTPN